MILAIPMLIIVGLVAGPTFAPARQAWMRRLLGWGVLVGAVAGADLALAGDDPILRMVGICCVLLAGMKGLVYAEWAAEGNHLPVHRYLAFACLWFGMDPASFRTKRQGLEWQSDVRTGLLLMLIGTLGAWLAWAKDWNHILLLFVPMSLGFHFGALRVLKGYLRYAGFPVRTLFPNLLETRGVGDFWSRRWNVGYSQMGDVIESRDPDGELAWHGEILKSVPEDELVFTFNHLTEEPPSTVRFKIEPEKDMVKLTITHEDFPEVSAIRDRVKNGWPSIIEGIKSLLETGATKLLAATCGKDPAVPLS